MSPGPDTPPSSSPPSRGTPRPTRRLGHRPVATVAVVLLALSGAPLRAQDETPAAELDRTEVAARGTQSVILTVARFGRYAITVKSPQGTSLQLVDRMKGPGTESGAAGETDGRLDVLLERGDYKVVARSHPRGTGTATLAVHPFEELDPEPRRLVELKPVEATLGDLQQRSYWIDVRERRRVVLEAAGRHLTDLRLWRDGTWVVAAEPTRRVVQPRLGRPLTILQLAPELEPGLYLLRAYGGPSLPWSADDGGQPFHLRFGIPRLAEADRRRMTVSPFGTDRYRVPGGASYFRIELPEAKPASLRVGVFDETQPFAEGGRVAEVVKESVPPVAEIQAPRLEEREHIVTITAEAGEPYVLQHFDLRYQYSFNGDGDYWLSSVHSGHAEDSVDGTAIVIPGAPWEGRRHVTPLAAQAVEIDAAHGWTRRANLLDTLTVFLKVGAGGTYEVLLEGVEARARIEPFLITHPERYRSPDLRGSGATWDLDEGYYVLTVEPVRKGIARITVRARGLMDRALDVVGLDRATPEETVRGAVRFPRLSLHSSETYTAYLNQQPEVRAGLVLRKLPIDLRDPLPVLQRPDEEVTVPVRCGEAGVIRAVAEDGSRLEVSLDGGAWSQDAAVEAGDHQVTVRGEGTSPVSYSLALVPTRLLATTPLPALPDTALAALPEFPVVAEGSPRFFDLGRQESATFKLRADEAGLYRVESTGLLATSGRLRTRTVTALATARQNGIGRNFSVGGYLGVGDYQVTVATEGRSAGHLGLTLERNEPVHGGYITSGIPARISLEPGQSVIYRFIITKPGTFRVRALALGRTLKWRLEDSGGWPLLAPGTNADLTRTFEPGHYRVIVLPETTATRVVTRIDPVRGHRRLSGHGPHRLPLAQRVEHEWREPEEGQPRVPDTWEVTVPADVDATVELTAQMQANLVRVGENGETEKVAFVPPGRGWRGSLARGRYHLEAVAARKNNRLGYQVAVWVDQLVAGLTRAVTPPAVIPVSVGETSLVELSSFGAVDVKARLTDGEGRPVAANDDRHDDWNFALSEALTPGPYHLAVDPVGGVRGSCEVSMRVPREEEKPPLALPAMEEIRLGAAPHLYPLPVPGDGDLLLLHARSPESVGVAVEIREEGAWRPVGSASGRTARLEILLPRAAASSTADDTYRLRLWSLDRRDTLVRLSALVATVARGTERDLARGEALAHVPAAEAAATTFTLDRPGVLDTGGEAGLRWCTAPLRPCVPASRGLVAATSGRLVAVGDAGKKARATRVILAPDEPAVVTLEAGTTITVDAHRAPGDGPVVVIASAREGQPGIRLVEGQETAGSTVMAVGERSALAVRLRPQHPAAHVWAATPPRAPFDTRLEARVFPEPPSTAADSGLSEGVLAAHRGRALDLPSGPKRIRLALDGGLAAALEGDGRLEAVVWAEDATLSETVETSAERMTILNVSGTSRRYSLEILPLGTEKTTAPLSLGAPVERTSLRAGVDRLAVVPGAAGRLHVRGHTGGVMFVSDSGLVSRGDDIDLAGDGGTLRVAHGVGPLLCWIDRPGARARDLWGPVREASPREVDLPDVVSLEGESQRLRVTLASPALLQLRSAEPLVSLLRRPAGEPRVDVHPSGAALDAFLPAGETDLLLRAFAGRSLGGAAELTATPVTPIEEGLGPETLLAPGRTTLFSFEVERPGAVGIGVRASADVVEAILMTADGEPLGRGPVQMPTLDPGTYLLALTCPAEERPVRARPALAGLAPPDSGPPADVIRRYLEAARLQGAEAAGAGGLPGDQRRDEGGGE